MDWVEEKWEEIKRYFHNDSIKRSLIWYCLGMFIVVAILIIFTKGILSGWMAALIVSSEKMEEAREPFDNVQELSMNDLIWILWSGKDYYTSLEKIFYSIYILFPYLYLIIAVFIMTKLFYNNKLKPALVALNNCTNAIANRNFDVELAYASKDELGICCDNVEKMRRYLVSEKITDWEAQEQQREINATFAHDMRTPLTVIEGYTEFLQRHIPSGRISNEMILEKLELMKYQEERLYEFSKTMTQIRKIEEREINKKPIKIESLVSTLFSVIKGVEQRSKREISINTNEIADLNFLIDIDEAVVLEIIENLLSNAVRYSKQMIEIIMVSVPGGLQISVCDDGEGFSKEAIEKAANTYYTEENNSKEHFGIGLSISTTLAKKHGGTLKLTNRIGGGAAVVFEQLY